MKLHSLIPMHNIVLKYNYNFFTIQFPHGLEVHFPVLHQTTADGSAIINYSLLLPIVILVITTRTSAYGLTQNFHIIFHSSIFLHEKVNLMIKNQALTWEEKSKYLWIDLSIFTHKSLDNFNISLYFSAAHNGSVNCRHVKANY